MQVNILWDGREYHSLENCLIPQTDEGFQIRSAIVGSYNRDIYLVSYSIKTNANWETLSCELGTQVSDNNEHFFFESDGMGNWTRNGKPVKDLEGCTDIDIPLTPFTNTLPVNRLQLHTGESRQIRAVYLDILNREIRAVEQKYTRLSETQYKYENVPNDFEAVITVDNLGLVVDYPGLFVRSEIRESHHQIN